MQTLRVVVLVLALAAVGAAGADQEQPRNHVSFSVERSREVENDWLTVVVGATHEDEDPGEVADRVNQDVNWGLGLVKGTRGVKVRTGGYTTRPISDPKRATLRRWRGSRGSEAGYTHGRYLLALGGKQVTGRLQPAAQRLKQVTGPAVFDKNSDASARLISTRGHPRWP